MEAVVRVGVTNGEPVNGIATELALYQTGEPTAQVADNEAVAPLQMVGEVTVTEGTGLTITAILALGLSHPATVCVT